MADTAWSLPGISDQRSALNRLSFSLFASVALSTTALPAQSIADRLSRGGDGTVQMRYAGRPEVCGDGADVVALRDLITVYPDVEGRGTVSNCVFGPVRAVLTLRSGEVVMVRVHVGSGRSRPPVDRDVGVVGAPEAARYFLDLAPTLGGRAARSAVMAAALADSADVWRPLLAIARDDRHGRDLRRAAMHWLAPTAPPEAASPLAQLVRDDDEAQFIREGALVSLAYLRDGAGVPTLIDFTRRDGESGWLREKAIFWLGNVDDERARRTVRMIAASDTVPVNLREQAIFALGHLRRDEDNGRFLRELYPRLESRRLREKIIQSMGQLSDAESEQWLIRIVRNSDEPLEVRKNAMFWRAQNKHAELDELIDLYPSLSERELKEHFTFVLSQRHEPEAVDKLIAIARSDPDRGIRSKAMFWLGQSKDPRAERFLREAIEK